MTNLNILMNDTNGISANTSLQRLNKELEMVGIHDDTSSIDKKTVENPMFKKWFVLFENSEKIFFNVLFGIIWYHFL